MEKIRRRQRCSKCGSLNVIRWGVRDNQQRYKCKDCGTLFIHQRKDVSSANRFVWFKKWVLGKQSIPDIALQSGYSERQLRRWFDEYLGKAPDWTIQRRTGIHLLVDGTWFANGHCLIVYRDDDSKSTLFYRFAEREDEYEISCDLQVFKELGIRIASFTTDGAEGIIDAIKYVYPYTIRQRCIVHVERECLTWLTQHPKTAAGIKLRRIVCQLPYVYNKFDRLYFIRELNEWYNEFEGFIYHKSINKDTGEETYTHDSVRKAYIHLHNAIPNLFKYIDHPGVPKSTNGLESFFGHVKGNLNIHRGLSEDHHDNFIKWYLCFGNEKKKKCEG